jgi:uncharacterized membrane protein YcjF (UPF0283 family)
MMKKTDAASESGESNDSMLESESFDGSSGVYSAPTDSNKRDDEVKQVQKLSQRETINVQLWRTVVLTLLVISGVAVATATHFFLRDAQETEFESNVSGKRVVW